MGRTKKGTGLLLGTWDDEKDSELDKKLNDPTVDENTHKDGLKELHKHFDPADPENDQSNPETKFFDHQRSQ